MICTWCIHGLTLDDIGWMDMVLGERCSSRSISLFSVIIDTAVVRVVKHTHNNERKPCNSSNCVRSGWMSGFSRTKAPQSETEPHHRNVRALWAGRLMAICPPHTDCRLIKDFLNTLTPAVYMSLMPSKDQHSGVRIAYGQRNGIVPWRHLKTPIWNNSVLQVQETVFSFLLQNSQTSTGMVLWWDPDKARALEGAGGPV